VSYHVEVSPEAQKEIKSLPGYVRVQVVKLIDGLAENPTPPRSKELCDKLVGQIEANQHSPHPIQS
jgi:mRNA-degrading endonuclease RelE of RelBE toxin-antitoxin system